MKKWHVYGSVVATKYLGAFEAETAEEAERAAMATNGQVSVCHHCSGEVENPQIESCAVEADNA
ncbi:hypothetical protein [Rhodopseudomonas pseudopalustris]|uniref:Uncharacterized protein n=1 Tax=Rhodopseudomonas pseudopalustris TaxID=1513892 RepID=A0A1H8WI53_9BRAD|nr:hypothetical protein [Rhodopseudomonas pseudopalustris]SEP27193.1 hypothetical protein SAMN05444123_112105 [Rhodopseudomonas pseudopalustris]